MADKDIKLLLIFYIRLFVRKDLQQPFACIKNKCRKKMDVEPDLHVLNIDIFIEYLASKKQHHIFYSK